MDPIIVIIVIVIALLGGLALGWFIGGKPAKDAAQATRDAVQAAKEAAQATDALRITLDGVRDERDAAKTELAALQADARNHDKQMQQLMEAKEALSAQFSEIGAKMLETAQRQFLERADQRFDQANEKGGEKIAKLLQPVRERLTAHGAAGGSNSSRMCSKHVVLLSIPIFIWKSVSKLMKGVYAPMR